MLHHSFDNAVARDSVRDSAKDSVAISKRRLFSVSQGTATAQYGENQVAVLQNLIYTRFNDIDQQPVTPFVATTARAERLVSAVSRAGGIIALIAALCALAAVIF